MTLQIRDETPLDMAAMETVIRAAFAHAVHASGTEHLIVSALRRCGQLSVSLVADAGGEIIGHVAVSPVEIDGGVAGHICGWYGLGPVSVIPERQRQGIGSRLVNEALARLRMLGADGCVVLGDPGYYGRFGFKAEPALIFPGFPPEYFQALSFTGTVPAGSVSFHTSFEAQS